MSKVFGIDLGTTYSCIAYLDEYGKPVVLKNSDGKLTTPSVVMVESATSIIVGDEAKRSIEVEPDKTVQFIKRKMGKEEDTVKLNGTVYTAPEISSYILKKLVQDANEELRQTGVLQVGEEIRDVVITCPAYFGMNERQATKTAGELAGLNVLNIINEPTAAAISYGVSGSAKDETVLVYDLGGGTFDITVMEIHGGQISVVCTGGDDQLGGKDWDECLMNYVMQQYQDEYDEDLSEDPDAVAALYVDVETWKQALTAREKVNMSVNGPAGRFRTELTREQYEDLTRDLLDRTKGLLDQVLAMAKEKGARIDKVLLVGGSSKMPQVAAMLQKDYGFQPMLSDPDQAVAKGAAIFAGNERAFEDFVQAEAARSGKSAEELKEEDLASGGTQLASKFARSSGGLATGVGRLSVTNVLSRTYGIEAESGIGRRTHPIIVNMLMANSPLPTTASDTFYTIEDGQTGVDLPLYESRSAEQEMEIEGRKPITTFKMTFKQSVPAGTGIDVTMALDNSGLLHVNAEEQCYHSKLEATFQLSNQMSDAEMSRALRRTSSASVE